MLLVEGEVLGEEWNNFGFDAIRDVVEVVAVVDFELMGDAIAGQDFIELRRVGSDLGVLVAGIKADGFELTQMSDVKVDHVELRSRLTEPRITRTSTPIKLRVFLRSNSREAASASQLGQRCGNQCGVHCGLLPKRPCTTQI